MSKATVQTVKTEFVTRKEGTKCAYRRLGLSTGVPLLLMHFRGTIDHWDPILVHTLAEKRPVILFDNAGVGHSIGSVDNTIPKMADNVIEFLDRINVKEVDVLGFSLGGVIAPLVELNGPKGLVRKLVLAGTQPTAGPDVKAAMEGWWPMIICYTQITCIMLTCPQDERVMPNAGASNLQVEPLLVLFFKESKISDGAGRAWWD
jgi:pimeloyl-ACP methyl ester carboxylesterase